MIRRSGLVAIGSLVSLVFVSCEQPTEIPLAPIRADATGPLTYFASRSDFLTQFRGLALETFEAGRVPDADTQGCPGPLDASSNNVCFLPGEIKAGIRFNSDHASGQDETGKDVALLGTGLGPGTSKQLVANFSADAFVIDFTTDVTAAGMDLVSYANDNCEIAIFGANGVLLGSTTAPCTNAGTFWGVSATEPISRITVHSPTGQFEGVDNVYFGTAAAPPAPPVANAGGPYTGVAGRSVHFDGSGSSDPGGATLTYQWNFGDGTPVVGGATPDHTYASAGTYTVTLTVSNGTLTGTATTTATIANVAPSLGAITGLTLDPVATGTPVTAGATFTDPGTRDTHTGTFDWGDGTPSLAVVIEANGSGAVSGTHSYVTPGVYTVSLTLTDKDGGSARSVFEFVVVYDPSAGFVTGGGWIDSPAAPTPPTRASLERRRSVSCPSI